MFNKYYNIKNILFINYITYIIISMLLHNNQNDKMFNIYFDFDAPVNSPLFIVFIQIF